LTETVPSRGLGDTTLELDRRSPSGTFSTDRPSRTERFSRPTLAQGSWLLLHYEARWVEDNGAGRAGLFPRWHLVVATIDGQAEAELHGLPSGSLVRWAEP
jgi:hypothetical protein